MTPYMFFKKNAGFSYDPKTETPEQGKRQSARALARAEREAQRQGIRFQWQNDELGCIGCDCRSDDCPCSTGEPHETLYCFAYQPSENDSRVILASLGGICGATDSYRRVVEAELALEALEQL